jgi:hypothetical protein
VPWTPRYTESEARAAIEAATSWAEVMDALGYGYFGNNIKTVRRWAGKWDISVSHLPNGSGSHRRHRHSAAELSEAVAASRSWAETLRRLGYCSTGGNWKTIKRRVAELGIATDHFDPYAASREALRSEAVPLEKVLVRGSTYSRKRLKRRLYECGLKAPICEMCGQDELWRSKRMSLILDHINGVRDDNRLANLRIVCPNCAATLDTHCGRKNTLAAAPRECLHCSNEFIPKHPGQRYCSRSCGSRWDRGKASRPRRRKVDRPPAAIVRREVETLGYSAVGRKYGVSDNAIRKWLREYEQERLRAEGRATDDAQIPTRTWPSRRRSHDPEKG